MLFRSAWFDQWNHKKLPPGCASSELAAFSRITLTENLAKLLDSVVHRESGVAHIPAEAREPVPV